MGTVLCSAAFVLLTIDTFRRIPKQTNQIEMTDAVVRGKHLFDRNNCMGCHTILGEGAYYAPELTKVWERRGEIFIKSMLRDPQAMYPNDRKMTNYHFTEEEINDLTAFLKWIGTMDLNGFPPKPDLAQPVSAAAVQATVAQPQIYGQVCVACHTMNGTGGNTGPTLDGIGSRRDGEYLTHWLKDPAAVKADSKMPKLPLTDEQIQELVTYLSQIK
ncbi:nitric oxide reductase, cytochrome c-containing subunit [Bdellovibrio bacteriovorus HD100]|uniref:Nitric oxide reductase, cytochrome c-containing subunit n=1 Tax=Bdellovibrio bacteriovorus (strain ATCC 15356 / DSM 50701 / NCIMB 9529 / HD100) TaxID=264462 RepID=Q6MK14_BDEBA|nr:nitric oxide reductase, cytochrome c-containing subunit [Bdellovibrio bacteriovorus HD100]